MLTSVQRVLILKSADLLRELGPRHLLELADVAREVELTAGETIFEEQDAADALYMVVEGRVRISSGGRTISEVGPGQTFGTWALVDDSSRGRRAECIEDGLALALHREAFYDVAAGDLTMLQEVVRALARRLRELVSERPEEARVGDEGSGAPAGERERESPAPPLETEPPPDRPATPGAALEAAALGESPPDGIPAVPINPAIPRPEAEQAAEQVEPRSPRP
jgi:hypothetical protein